MKMADVHLGLPHHPGFLLHKTEGSVKVYHTSRDLKGTA